MTESSDNESVLSNKEEKFSRLKFIIVLFGCLTCLKILLIPTYHSTDFEVHRNWLAITYNLPIQQWYEANHSIWTLDYPPFFAWYEYLMSKPAALFDPEMLKINNLNYASNETILYQRMTVMLSDIFLVVGIQEVSKVFCHTDKSFIAIAMLILCNIGLLMIDHIHFQYNGFLLGILLISLGKVSNTQKGNQMLIGAFCFAILLNLKHIYLYIAPAYGIWCLKFYCFNNRRFLMINFIKLFLMGIFILLLSFGPFYHQLPQVLSRLFPFKRGLLHAYWAANGWVVYAIIDKILSWISIKQGWMNRPKIATMTGGLVLEESFNILPTPTPLATFIITFIAMLPILYQLLISPKNSRNFIRSIILCGLTAFMFGWHVHEKAILTAIIPLSILAPLELFDARIFVLLSSAGHTAIMPLLFPDNMIPLKYILFITFLILSFLLLDIFSNNCRIFKKHEIVYIVLLPIITTYETIVHKLFFIEKLPFLALALTSLYCAVGVIYSYIIYYYHFITSQRIEQTCDDIVEIK